MKYRNWIAHGLILLALAIAASYYIWLLPQILKYWQEMFACEGCIKSTYDILPLLAPPLPIILLMAWWARTVFNKEIHTPRKQLGHSKEPSKPDNTEGAIRSERVFDVTGEWLSRDETPSQNISPVMLEESSADSTTPATTNLKNGNKPEDK